jgi:hypothetical protein
LYVFVGILKLKKGLRRSGCAYCDTLSRTHNSGRCVAVAAGRDSRGRRGGFLRS